MRTERLKMDANGELLNAVGAGAYGFAVLPWLPPPEELVFGERPGSFPLRAEFGNGETFELHNSEALYFDKPLPGITLRGGRANECFRLVTLEKGQVFAPGQSKGRRAFHLVEGSFDLVDDAPTGDAAAGWEIRPGWLGFNIYLSLSGNSARIWYRPDATTDWQVSETLTESGFHFRAVNFPHGRIFVDADAAGGSYGLMAVAEVA